MFWIRRWNKFNHLKIFTKDKWNTFLRHGFLLSKGDFIVPVSLDEIVQIIQISRNFWNPLMDICQIFLMVIGIIACFHKGLRFFFDSFLQKQKGVLFLKVEKI